MWRQRKSSPTRISQQQTQAPQRLTAGRRALSAALFLLTATPPAPKKIDTSADPVCGQKNPNLLTDDTIVKDGKLANVFVYMKEGTADGGKKIAEYTWATPTAAAQLDQNGCHYAPHVMGVQVNQKISITNSDATQHNIHPTPKLNPEWNQTQSAGQGPIEKSFARAEVLIPVKCNQHPWMKAYIGVMKHPLFAVSSDDWCFRNQERSAGHLHRRRVERGRRAGREDNAGDSNSQRCRES